MDTFKLTLGLLTLILSNQLMGEVKPPIIDMHMHAPSVSEWDNSEPVAICAPFSQWLPWSPEHKDYDSFFANSYLNGKACDTPIWSASSDKDLMLQTISIMKSKNIYGVLSESVDKIQSWQSHAPNRFIPALRFNIKADPHITPDVLQQLVSEKKILVFGEIWNWYDGISPDDKAMQRFWALAEELDIPVGYHLNGGRPGEPLAGYGARAALISPLSLENVLIKHPRLRLYIMHGGYPFIDDLIAILYSYPNVYIDISSTVLEPTPAFYYFLKRLIDAGFIKRIMYGSDQSVWPEIIERSIGIIENAPFLSEQQKRDIFYHNAARFLRLSEDKIAQHHSPQDK